MDSLDILVWAARNHYPRLVLSERAGDVLEASRESWCAFVARMSEGEYTRLLARMGAWDGRSKRQEGRA